MTRGVVAELTRRGRVKVAELTCLGAELTTGAELTMNLNKLMVSPVYCRGINTLVTWVMVHGPVPILNMQIYNRCQFYIIKYFENKKLTISENFLDPLCHGAEKFQGGQITIQGGQLPHLPPPQKMAPLLARIAFLHPTVGALTRGEPAKWRFPPMPLYLPARASVGMNLGQNYLQRF